MKFNPEVAIIPVCKLRKDLVQTYWQQLYVHDLLKYRLCDIEDPTFADVEEMMSRMLYNMFMVADMKGTILGEFMLENRTGDAWQIHFSIHPSFSYQDKLKLLRLVRRQLHSWPNMHTLYGLIPESNKTAWITTIKAGFKRIGILPKGVSTYQGAEDAVILISTGEQ
jgi:hypothetical protein